MIISINLTLKQFIIQFIIKQNSIDTLYHAAAYKHVPMVEKNVCNALYNNVIGTRNVLRASLKAGVQSFTMISTDKAVNPTSVLGISKRIAEIICQNYKNAKNIFKHLGEVVEIRNEKLSNKFWATASIMAAYYEILNVSSNWLTKKGINKTIANNYISELFLALSQDAVNKRSQGFKKLVADSQTPKGLNMQVLNELKRGKFYNKFTKAMDNINKRVSS